MRIIIEQGRELLNIVGYSIEDSTFRGKLVVNFKDKGIVKGSIFSSRGNRLYINTANGVVVIGFSCPVAELVLEGYYKDQLVYTLYKQESPN